MFCYISYGLDKKNGKRCLIFS